MSKLTTLLDTVYVVFEFLEGKPTGWVMVCGSRKRAEKIVAERRAEPFRPNSTYKWERRYVEQ